MARKILPLLLVLASLSFAACGEYGKVEQGRTVAYDDSTKPATVTVIKDAGTDDKHPQYTVLPPLVFTMPTDPDEIGPLPKAGLRLNLDVEKKTITMFDPTSKQFETISIEVVEKHDDVDSRKQHPLVYDAATRKERKFPVVNAADQSVQIYSRRQKMLCTIKVPPADFAKYKEADWDAGDEVRIYYKEPGKALRFMNVSKTDVTRR